MTGKIFINYRRGDDPGNAGRLFDRLQEAFAPEQLFMDVDSIAPGLDFVRVLEEQVGQCDALLAVIGKGWIDARDHTGVRRLDNPEDFVRIEIESALKQNKRVIPVLVGDTRMPRPEELPEAIRALAKRNAVRLTHERFRADAQGLIKALQRALEDVEALRQAHAEAERKRQEDDANARAAAQRDAEEQARRDKEKARLTAIAGLPADQVSKAEEPRDLRADFFMGIALWFIFLDLIPQNIVSAITVYSYEFSDGNEIFIFVCGYIAGIESAAIMSNQGLTAVTKAIYARVGQAYMAYLLMFVFVLAVMGYFTLRLQTTTYEEELQISAFVRESQVAIIKLLLLQYQFDLVGILPLYILLLAVFPLVAWLLSLRPLAPLFLSLMIYLLTMYFGWESKTYPNNEGWFFNPFAWQFLFVVGACAGYNRIVPQSTFPPIPYLSRIAVAVALVIAVVKVSWTLHSFSDAVPALFWDQLEEYAFDKSDLSPLRLISFFALMLAVLRFLPKDTSLLKYSLTRWIMMCGRHSLHVLCLGLLLSVLGRMAVTVISSSLAMQLSVNLIGLALMIAFAKLMSSYSARGRLLNA